eukprot:4584327-Pleurochrysis_carterae.AAC.2
MQLASEEGLKCCMRAKIDPGSDNGDAPAASCRAVFGAFAPVLALLQGSSFQLFVCFTRGCRLPRDCRVH